MALTYEPYIYTTVVSEVPSGEEIAGASCGNGNPVSDIKYNLEQQLRQCSVYSSGEDMSAIILGVKTSASLYHGLIAEPKSWSLV